MTCDCPSRAGDLCGLQKGCKAVELMERLAQQQAGTHPAPCARSCEANAYQIEIRRLNAEIASLRNAISNEHRQGALDAQSEAILICARIEDEQEGASGETWARTIRTEIERMLIDNA